MQQAAQKPVTYGSGSIGDVTNLEYYAYVAVDGLYALL